MICNILCYKTNEIGQVNKNIKLNILTSKQLLYTGIVVTRRYIIFRFSSLLMFFASTKNAV